MHKLINVLSKSARVNWRLRHEALKTIYRVIEKDGRDLKPLHYLDVLEQFVFPRIETFEPEIVIRFIFKQDRSPAHFGCFVTDILNDRFPDPWIGRGGPIPKPPRSPDLFPIDFSLWGYIKNIVYAEKIRNIQHLQVRISSAIETVTRDIIQKTWKEVEFYLNVSRATNGAHIEMY